MLRLGRHLFKASVCGQCAIPSWRSVRVASNYTASVSSSGKVKTKSDNLGEGSLSFNDPKSAYESKTTREILRALFVLKLCSVNFLVDNNQKVRKMSNYFWG